MPARWSKEIEITKHQELHTLYVTENKTIGEIGKILQLADSTVFDRLLRLGIKPNRYKKTNCNNTNNHVVIPTTYTSSLAEFMGIMLGDGCITPTQVTVTLGNKELDYVTYISKLITRLFKVVPKIHIRKKGYYVVYFGSTKAVRWFLSNGFAFNKVKSQVKIPSWIFTKQVFKEAFLRGFFDTDGSVYRVRFGVQLNLTNKSLPLLDGARHSLSTLGYYPSKISSHKIYVTRKECVLKFFKHIRPSNIKHRQRFEKFVEYYCH